MKTIRILGTGCSKCKTTYSNVLEALKQLSMEANVIKIEDIQEMMKYNILSTPVLMIDDDKKIIGRVPSADEIKKLLTT
jgi:small redox-active disulfide protein 2